MSQKPGPYQPPMVYDPLRGIVKPGGDRDAKSCHQTEQERAWARESELSPGGKPRFIQIPGWMKHIIRDLVGR